MSEPKIIYSAISADSVVKSLRYLIARPAITLAEPASVGCRGWPPEDSSHGE
jgi:hypothetical protein